MKQRWLGVVAIGFLLALGSAVPAIAAPILNFDQDNLSIGTGTISYDGNGGALVGSGIRFDWLSATGAPTNNGVLLFCDDGCFLNFATGANTGQEGPSTWNWNGGGSFTITGSLFTGANGTGTPIASGTLVTGAFTGTVTAQNFGAFLMALGAGIDSKDPDMLAFWGLDPQTFVFAENQISTTGFTLSGNGGFSANVATADFVNTAVPEPGTILLLGFGLVGAAFARRRLS